MAPGAEAADRAWVSTDAGPALCGRSGKPRKPQLACTVLTDAGWRRAELPRRTDWGHVGSRHFVTTDGDAAYCRTVGRPSRPRATCTVLDATTLTWGRDVRSGRLPLLADGRVWTSTDAGPALCGLGGGAARQRLGCAVLTDAGWRYRGLHRSIRWGAPTSRAFVADGDRVSFCRTVSPRPSTQLLSCTPFYAGSLKWGYDRKSDPVGGRSDRGHLAADGRRPGIVRHGSRGLPRADLVGLALRPGPLGRQRPRDQPGVRRRRRRRLLVPHGPVRIGVPRLPAPPSTPTSCAGSGAVVSSTSRALATVNRGWLDTAAGPALCGRAGTEKGQRVGCHVLTEAGWRWTRSARRSPWGHADYRAFLPTADGVSYCRTLGAASVACTGLDASLSWGATEKSARTDLTYADPF